MQNILERSVTSMPNINLGLRNKSNIIDFNTEKKIINKENINTKIFLLIEDEDNFIKLIPSQSFKYFNPLLSDVIDTL